MGILLSICFKTKDQDGAANPQHQAKRKGKKGQVTKSLSVSKQHLLGTPDQSNSRQQGYNSMGMPASPKPQPNSERPPMQWGRPPDSPSERRDNKDTPSQLFGGPPTPTTPTQRDPDKRPVLSKALSLNIGSGKDRNNSPGKTGRRRRMNKKN